MASDDLGVMGRLLNISVNPGVAIWSIWLVVLFKMGVFVRHLSPCCEPDSSVQGQPKTPIQYSFIRINISNLIIHFRAFCVSIYRNILVCPFIHLYPVNIFISLLHTCHVLVIIYMLYTYVEQVAALRSPQTTDRDRPMNT